MSGPAPIAAFIYKRPLHARRMLESLARNPECAGSPLWIFCDGPRGTDEAADVAAARRAAREAAPAHAQFVEREHNLGLARSVIAGVSELAQAHGRVIVLEDDLVLSPFALRYFNRALDRYRDEERVMHVSGYMYPVESALPEAFFYREATCWGWATWARAWQHFEPDAERIREFVLRGGTRRRFDAGGSMPFFRMLGLQIEGRIDSWAIRWYGTLHMRGGLALHPGRSLVENRGHDGSGRHGDLTGDFAVPLAEAPVDALPATVQESAAAAQALRAFRWRRARRSLAGLAEFALGHLRP